MTTAQTGDTVQTRRLFAVAFCAIIATSFCFVIRALVVNQWGVELSLSETQKGELLGVGLWPFAISIVLLSLIVDRIGFKAVLCFAAVGHIVGVAVIIAAHSYWALYLGTLAMALGNGAVEAAANPLIATLYPDDKPRWLNRLHAAWPLGMILGGLVALGLGPDIAWRGKMLLIALPVSLYAGLLIGTRFPPSERVAAGVSYKAMLAEAGYVSAFIVSLLIMMEIGRIFDFSTTLIVGLAVAATIVFGYFARAPGRPLFILLVLLMIPLATTELSTDSWISSLMEPEMTRLNLSAGWVLIYTSLIVFLIRLIAGSIIDRIGAVETLCVASLLAAAGLFLLSGANGMLILIAATLYGIGKSFFWGTTLAVTSEQFPKGGAVTLNVMGGVGMLAAGILGSVLLGTIQDRSSVRAITRYDQAQSTTLSRDIVVEHAGMLGTYRSLDNSAIARLPVGDRTVVAGVVASSKRQALAEVSLLPIVTACAFALLALYFRLKGGYRKGAL